MKKQLLAAIAAMVVLGFTGSISLHAQNATKAQASSSNTTVAENSMKADLLPTEPVSLHAAASAAAPAPAFDPESPAAIHYKGVSITPVAFFAGEGVWRQHSVNSDINTPFNTIPMPGANEGHISELNFSGRQSRLGVLVEANDGTYKFTGYGEMDFLSAGATSNNNQSNSYTMRQRQIWGKVETQGGFAMSGGQMWSLVTRDGTSTNNRTEKLPNTIDAQYMVGFSWERQPSFRIQQRWGDPKTGAFTAALAVEQAQITGFTATSATSGAVPTNFYFAGAGQGGGLYNAYSGTYANNVAPDLIVKGAWDMPKAHIELGGLARFLRDYYFPITNTTGGYTYSANAFANTKAAGGIFGSVSVSPNKYADLTVEAMAGDGVGRYGSSQLADATIRPDGTLEPVRNYHGLYSLETHPTPKLDLFAYYGGEYAQRTVYTTAQGYQIGYGAPNLVDSNCYALPVNPASSTGGSITPTTNCNSPTRYIQEGLLGFTYRLINSPKLGRLQYAVNYELVNRSLWSGAQSISYRAQDNMVLTSLRYYIP